MKMYSYVATDMAGNVVKGTMNCDDSADLQYKLHERGLFYVSHTEDGSGSINIYRFNTKDLAYDCRQLSAMMSSGLSLVKALDILSKEEIKEKPKKIWRDIYEDVNKGQSFSESLKKQNDCFPSFLISMINAGESSGSLDSVMDRMAEHYAKENKMNNKIKGAITYPIILSVICVLVVILMVSFVLPKFEEMFSGMELPALTKALLGFVKFFKSKWWVIVIIIAGIVWAFIAALKIPEFKIKVDEFKLNAPGFGKLMKKIYTGRFARTLSSLYSSGIPMVECLERSSAILTNRYIDKLFENVIDEVKQGELLSNSIQKTQIFDSMFCSIIFVGEESGQLDDILIKSSDYYEDEADSALQKMVTYIEPIMIVFMGLCVGLIMAAIFPAMYSMYKNIG